MSILRLHIVLLSILFLSGVIAQIEPYPSAVWGCSSSLEDHLVPSYPETLEHSSAHCLDPDQWTCDCSNYHPSNADPIDNRRSVLCIEESLGLVLEDKYCAHLDRPDDVFTNDESGDPSTTPAPCADDACDQYDGTWLCVKNAQGIVPEVDISELNPVSDLVQCTGDHFSECELDGCCIQERTVICLSDTVDPDSGDIEFLISDSHCFVGSRPLRIRRTFTDACDWDYACATLPDQKEEEEGEDEQDDFDHTTLDECTADSFFSECSTTCGVGRSSRLVVCASQVNSAFNSYDSFYFSQFCTDEPPKSQTTCKSFTDCSHCENPITHGTECENPSITNLKITSNDGMVTPFVGESMTLTWSYIGRPDVHLSIRLDLSKAVENHLFPMLIAVVPADAETFTYVFPQSYQLLMRTSSFIPTVGISVAIADLAPVSLTAQLLSKCSSSHPSPLDCGSNTCQQNFQRCVCESGFTGDRCEKSICDDIVCLNGGTCSSTGIGAGQCSCESPYTGSRCHINTTCRSRQCNNRGFIDFGKQSRDKCDTQCTCDGHWDDDGINPRGGCLLCGLECPRGALPNKSCTACQCPKGFSGEQCTCRHIQTTLHFQSIPPNFDSYNQYNLELLASIFTRDLHVIADARGSPIPLGKLSILEMKKLQDANGLSVIIQIQDDCSGSGLESLSLSRISSLAALSRALMPMDNDSPYTIDDAYDSYNAIHDDISAADSSFPSTFISSQSSGVTTIDAIYDPNCSPTVTTVCPDGPEPALTPDNSSPEDPSDDNGGGDGGDGGGDNTPEDSDGESSLASDWKFWLILLCAVLIVALLVGFIVLCVFRREQCFGRYKRQQQLSQAKSDVEL